MRATITKKFKFEASHSLPHHDGKCQNLHGHSYVVEVQCADEVRQEGPKQGMVVDFADLKSVWNATMKPFLDHCDLNSSLKLAPHGVALVPVTTAEHIAAWICWCFRNAGVPVVTVEVWETATASARVNVSEVWGV